MPRAGAGAEAPSRSVSGAARRGAGSREPEELLRLRDQVEQVLAKPWRVGQSLQQLQRDQEGAGVQ
jgi:hypothetical protein